MAEKKMRTCILCGERLCKDNLIRFVRTPEGVVADPKGRMPGRGAYACPDHGERNDERMRRGLERTLRTHIDRHAFELLAKDYDVLCVGHSDVR